MKNIKSFLFGVITMLLCVIFVNTVTGAQLSKEVTIEYNNIKISVDGKPVEPKDANGNIVEPFIYEGSTYLPVRAVANAMGYDVDWNDSIKTVILTKKVPTSANSGYSRTNPAPIGTSQTISIKNYSNDYTATIKIVEVISGDEAWKKINEANLFNSQAGEGKMYILAKIEAKVDKINNDKSVSFSGYNFNLFSAQNVEYAGVFVVDPTPAFSGQVFDGGVLTGYVSFLVDKTDSAPKIVYGMNYDGSGGIWFSLK